MHTKILLVCAIFLAIVVIPGVYCQVDVSLIEANLNNNATSSASPLVFALPGVNSKNILGKKCPPTSDCALGCSVVSIHGCDVCQCSSIHPCVMMYDKPPLGCTSCIPVYAPNGCVHNCTCTTWLRDQMSDLGNFLWSPFKKVYV